MKPLGPVESPTDSALHLSQIFHLIPRFRLFTHSPSHCLLHRDLLLTGLSGSQIITGFPIFTRDTRELGDLLGLFYATGEEREKLSHFPQPFLKPPPGGTITCCADAVSNFPGLQSEGKK